VPHSDRGRPPSDSAQRMGCFLGVQGYRRWSSRPWSALDARGLAPPCRRHAAAHVAGPPRRRARGGRSSRRRCGRLCRRAVDTPRITPGIPDDPREVPILTLATRSCRPCLAGLRSVATSGERKDVPWTVPISAAADPGGWFVGCHIPGQWAAGMVVPVRFVGPDGEPLRTREPLSTPGVGTNGTLRAPGWAGGSAASR